MHNPRWSIAFATAALLALPVASFAQGQYPPAQPRPQQTPAQPTQPSQPSQPSQQAQTPSSQSDVNAAKTHLSAARDTLSQLTSLPEAAKLQGDARTQVSQLISNFNTLITAQSDWRSAYNKVDANLASLLGPESGDQPVGTAGGAAATATGQLDPAVRAKLTEFRMHLKEFEKAAGGPAKAEGSMPPSAPTPTTSNPANPASAASPMNPTSTANPANPPSPTGTSGVSAASPTAGMDAADRARAASQVSAAGNADAQKELDAISAILAKSKTGALTRAQTAQLKKHVEALRALLK